MAESEGDTSRVLVTVGWFMFGLLAVLVCRYGFNLFKANELAARLHKRRPARSIPEISLGQDIVGSMLTAAVMAPFICIVVFLMASCDTLFSAEAPPPDWAMFWRFTGFLVWPLLSYGFIWPRNRQAANLRKSLDGAISLANGAGSLGRYALYLRSVTGDRRTIHTQTGPEGQSGDVHVQPAAFELKSILRNRVKVYALWDPHRDARPTLHFLPILSSDDVWKDDVIALAEHAIFIVADFEADKHGDLGQGMTWEIQLLLAHPNMLGKTLAIVSADDPPSDKLAEVTTNARWKVQVESRNSYGGNFRKVPEELLGLISQPKD